MVGIKATFLTKVYKVLATLHLQVWTSCHFLNMSNSFLPQDFKIFDFLLSPRLFLNPSNIFLNASFSGLHLPIPLPDIFFNSIYYYPRLISVYEFPACFTVDLNFILPTAIYNILYFLVHSRPSINIIFRG